LGWSDDLLDEAAKPPIPCLVSGMPQWSMVTKEMRRLARVSRCRSFSPRTVARAARLAGPSLSSRKSMTNRLIEPSMAAEVIRPRAR
jgi:hypothetical protein